MHGIPDKLLHSQDSLTLKTFENSKRSHKGQFELCWDFDMENIPIKLHYDASYFRGVIVFTKCYCLPHNWPWGSSAIQKRQTKINVELMWELDVENTHIKLNHNACNSWSYHVHKAACPYVNLKEKVTHNWVNDKLLWIYTFQNDACNSWGVIAFSRPFDFGLDWVKKGSTIVTIKLEWNVNEENIYPVMLQHIGVKFTGVVPPTSI